jgi:hypothetical protein
VLEGLERDAEEDGNACGPSPAGATVGVAEEVGGSGGILTSGELSVRAGNAVADVIKSQPRGDAIGDSHGAGHVDRGEK